MSKRAILVLVVVAWLSGLAQGYWFAWGQVENTPDPWGVEHPE